MQINELTDGLWNAQGLVYALADHGGVFSNETPLRHEKPNRAKLTKYSLQDGSY